jgi:FlaA1/EpsC-like NDP-sugar epimerase
MNALVLKYRSGLIFLTLSVSVLLAPALAFLLRFDFHLVEIGRRSLLLAWAVVAAFLIKIPVFYFGRVHRGWSGQVGTGDFTRLVTVNVCSSAVFSLFIYFRFGPSFPRSIYILDFLVIVGVVSCLRLGIRLFRERAIGRPRDSRKHILIYGAGRAGAALAREIISNPRLNMRVVGFIDDDSAKRDESTLGVPVLGSGEELGDVIQRLSRRGIAVEQILISLPSASAKAMRRVAGYCRDTEVPCKTLPGISSLIDGCGLSGQIRDIALEDLLGREPVELDREGIRAMIENVPVLVTGAAGSIGSELCRQVASFGPKHLVLLDQAESALFAIDMELRRKYPHLHIAAEIGDVRDRGRLDGIMRTYGVDTVFHAAAYKHVPLMETHVVEAAQNNVIGTWNLAQSAAAHGVKTFVMISTDKAVNPASIMGSSKRAAELIVSSLAGGKTKFVSVRFGNVLGSNGSVVPIFQAQIAAHGPVTVTHPEIRRYFMTIQEAVQLILQASIMGKESQIFVLDMGEPVRIVDLARNMIRLAGMVPGKDIQIEFTGLRPGEKLYEELITAGENILPTYHKKINIFESRSTVDPQFMEQWVDTLRHILLRRDHAGVVRHLASLIPEYEVSPQWANALHLPPAAAGQVEGSRLTVMKRQFRVQTANS